jgi:serine/threonine protein kinase
MGENYKPKLADFGLSQIKTDTNNTTGGPKGTLAWMAPELYQKNRKYEKSCDIFSLAMILWEITSRKKPFEKVESATRIVAFHALGNREEIPEDTPKPMSLLINKCWAQKPEDRPVIDEVVAELDAIKASLS